MDFTKLTAEELVEFLRSNRVTISEEPLEKQAKSLFTRLVETGGTTFTYPVLDLYIATQLKGRLVSPQQYTREEILSAPVEAIEEFAKVFTTSDRRRIIHILRLMEMLKFTIGEMLSAFENSKIWYTIPSNKKINTELTEDQLYRHVIDELGEWQAAGFDVRRVNDKQYLALTPNFRNLQVDDEFMELPVTKENISLAFNEEYPEMARHGALSIARSFKDTIHFEDGDWEDLNLTYNHIDVPDSRLLEHIVIV